MIFKICEANFFSCVFSLCGGYGTKLTEMESAEIEYVQDYENFFLNRLICNTIHEWSASQTMMDQINPDNDDDEDSDDET